ncbi:serine protease [Coprinopsis sp. MPI-PUGE-AT-0042]|nr:serine protease [Coprinopsis sp. MPI-PUGE-AT-0042]
MRFLSLFAALAVVALPSFVLAAPQGPGKAIRKYSGEKNGGHIVKLKPGVSRKQLAKKLKLPPKAVDLGIVNGFYTDGLDKATLDALTEADEVDYVAEDGYAHGTATLTQYNAGWNLKRVSQPGNLGPNPDVYGPWIYVDFGGRATWGATFGVPGSTDDHGHGTHIAGTAAGFMFGVAKNASLIAVKVLDNTNRGPIYGVVQGLDWIREQVALSGRPSVVSISLMLVFTLSSVPGNANDDAANWSPGRVASAITVGATDIYDNRAGFSNYGPVVDIFAPGVDVISAGIAVQHGEATMTMSGTSMATPHISGLVAYLIAKDGNLAPAAMETKVRNLAAVGYISGLPAGTANRMAQVPL